MSYEFGLLLTDTPHTSGSFSELQMIDADDFVGEWINWDDEVAGYSGWNISCAQYLAEVTDGANYELLSDLGNQSYVRLNQRQAALDKFEEHLDKIDNPAVWPRCAALIAGCRDALDQDFERATLLVF